MNSFVDSNRHSTDNSGLNITQEELHKHSPPHYPSLPIVPMVQTVSFKFTDRPIIINCPYCGHRITTVIEEENGVMPYILCISMALCGLVLGCCLIPFCISELKDKIHYCPRCQREIGKKTLL